MHRKNAVCLASYCIQMKGRSLLGQEVRGLANMDLMDGRTPPPGWLRLLLLAFGGLRLLLLWRTHGEER